MIPDASSQADDSGVQIELGYRPGVIGRIAELHALYYGPTWGVDVTFEAEVASQLSEFLCRYDSERDALWTVRLGSSVEGSIAIDGQLADDEGARLRWFLLSDRLRARGVGRRLVRSAMNFCRSRGFERVFLLTFRGLEAARHLYEAAGFRLVEEWPETIWGTEILEQRFEWRAPTAGTTRIEQEPLHDQ